MPRTPPFTGWNAYDITAIRYRQGCTLMGLSPTDSYNFAVGLPIGKSIIGRMIDKYATATTDVRFELLLYSQRPLRSAVDVMTRLKHHIICLKIGLPCLQDGTMRSRRLCRNNYLN